VSALGWVFLAIVALVVVGMVLAVLLSLPEIRRYMKIRSM
jgi:hypothetical protein